MTSAYERGTQAPMDITELGPRKPSVFDAPVSDLSMASPDASLMDIDPDVPSMPPPTLAPLPLVSPQMEAPRPSEVPPPLAALGGVLCLAGAAVAILPAMLASLRSRT